MGSLSNPLLVFPPTSQCNHTCEYPEDQSGLLKWLTAWNAWLQSSPFSEQARALSDRPARYVGMSPLNIAVVVVFVSPAFPWMPECVLRLVYGYFAYAVNFPLVVTKQNTVPPCFEWLVCPMRSLCTGDHVLQQPPSKPARLLVRCCHLDWGNIPSTVRLLPASVNDLCVYSCLYLISMLCICLFFFLRAILGCAHGCMISACLCSLSVFLPAFAFCV